jgi:signal transduction histidine kinase
MTGEDVPAADEGTLIPVPSSANSSAAPSATMAAPGSLVSRAARRLRRTLSSVRLRLVWWFVVVLAATTIVSVFVGRQILSQQVDARVEAELRQEIDEVERLARGNDPETGEPFAGDVPRIFQVALQRNVPARYELLLAYVDGAVVGQSGGEEAPRVDELPVGRWAAIDEAAREQLDVGRAQTIDVVAVPFRVDGEARGVFLVAIDRETLARDADQASLAVAAAGLLMLVVGSLLAVRLSDRILAPVREVRQTAQAISVTDLSRRIDVRGHDEIAELAMTFNEMLDRLEGAFATQRRFIDDASHELRTPVTVIRGHLDTLGADPDDRARTLALLDDELERMGRLVDDLVTLARSERPDFLRLAPVDLGDLTREVAGKASALGDRAWVMEAVAEEPVRVDAQRVTQAVLQLAENAVRHTRDGDRIGIGSAAAGAEVRLWVADTGTGVAEEDRARIFERFARGREARRRSDGSGLGLSIVAAIAEGHGGRVELESPATGGATFVLVLPREGGSDT